jgi:hypothetical protein
MAPRIPVSISHSKTMDEVIVHGVPASESAMTISISDCAICGVSADEIEGGKLSDIEIKDGVMSAEMICVNCCDDSDTNYIKNGMTQ